MKTNNVVNKKIQIKIDNISFLQKQLKDYDFLSEEDILILLKNFEKTTKDEMSIHFERYFQDDVFASVLLSIANRYRENKKIQIGVITSLGNMINRYYLKETEVMYHYFKSQMFVKGISAYVSIYLPYFKNFQKEENKWDYFMKLSKMSPKKIAESNFLAIVSKYSREIPTEYKAQVIDFVTEKQEKANHKSGQKYFQELINDIRN